MSACATTETVATATKLYQFRTSPTEHSNTFRGSTRCTLNHNFNDTAYDEYRAGAIGGDVLSLDYECQVYYGSGSSACRTKSSTMCYSGIYCRTSTGCNGRMHLVKEHTQCDTNKYLNSLLAKALKFSTCG
ncbi:hypothetical protein CHS0354_041280 [Potamilus streckersoni]|uniref:Uncharacterized protein n=1 Tax=Potamilus streckersoni TaxID=2493646 RepID=A0AAE0VU53_9BIVA|nr:hypothetical protein CHS0354_041280 [Potamilus streckersoni]